MIVVGTPVHGGRPSEKIQAWVKSIPAGGLEGVHIAVFDTRFAMKDHELGLKLLMKTIGFAADKLARQLTKLGGRLVLPAEGFIVKDKKGPLATGELERAEKWGEEIGKVGGLYKEK